MSRGSEALSRLHLNPEFDSTHTAMLNFGQKLAYIV